MMYAKLMARITESSLMEESIVVRYTFMMMLAVADPKGYAIGTDVALARRMNMPVSDFKSAVDELMKPDPDSNSKEQDGRRIIESDGERGYFVVNYGKYRDTRNEEERREWMRDYMQKYREQKGSVNSRKQRKHRLANAEEHVAGESESAVPPPKEHTSRKSAPPAGIVEGKDSILKPTTPQSIRIATLYHRSLKTAWTKKERAAYRELGTIPEEDLAALERYYGANWPPTRGVNILRTDLLTLLNNFPGEVGRAHASVEKSQSQQVSAAVKGHV